MFQFLARSIDESYIRKIKIGKHCWIAANVTILKGVTIGDNCVIGAGCVVKQNIPAGSIVTQINDLKIEQIQERN